MNFKTTTLTLDQLAPIFDGITDAVFIDDSKGICRWCNGACEEMYNTSYEEIVGKSVDELEKAGIFTPSVTKRVLKEKRELTIIHENRFGKRLLTTGSPVFSSVDDSRWVTAGEGRYDGHISFVVTTSRDITDISNMPEGVESEGMGTGEAAFSNAKPVKKGSRKTSSKATAPADSLERLSNEKVIVTNSEAMQNVVALAKKLATVNSTVLITGESGVGKGLIARTIHNEGIRWKGPFITVNCGAIPESLIESELFGYVAGAFKGTRSKGKKGLFEAAANGTIFLDEISELSLNLQVKLLQVIQEREITPVGSAKPVPVDVRIISAADKNLEELVKEGRFREDLYYRLNVVPISVPPLRERIEDIPPLIQLNLAKCNSDMEEEKSLSPEALAIMVKYPWPGNVRELQNIVERLVITSSGSVIQEDDIFIFIKKEADRNPSAKADMSLTSALEKAEKEILADAVKMYGSTRAIAKALDVSQPTIVRKLNKYGLGK